MRDKDPLESWLYLDRARRYDEMPAEFYEHSRAALGRLSTLLEAPISKKVNLAESGIYECSRNALAPSDLSRACELCRRVVARGGSGSTFVQEGLLEMIASAKDLASIPFWLEILDISRPRDSFAEKRRVYALAALARIALRRNAPEGYEPLRTAARHQNPEVRGVAHMTTKVNMSRKALSESEIDDLVVAQADDESAWSRPVQVRTAKPASFSIPAGLTSPVAASDLNLV